MKNNRNPLEIVREFCLAWFAARDLERAARHLSEDIFFVGTGEGENVSGLQSFREYMRRDLEESGTPFELEFIEEQENNISENAAIVLVEFNMKNSEYKWHIHGTVMLTADGGRTAVDSADSDRGRPEAKSEGVGGDRPEAMSGTEAGAGAGWIIRHLHFAIPTALQEPGEHYPLTLVKKQIAEARHDLLSSSVAGGLMGGYLEEKFPFYYVNDRMLTYLGYDSEAEFVEDIGGYISNCMHPDDQSEVDRSVSEQLADGDEYHVEYRMRKKNGSYIYVHDVGRVITAEDGRSAIISVCTDISDQRFERQQNESLINAMNGGTMLCKIRDGACEPTYFSSGIGRITGYNREELAVIIAGNTTALIYPPDREKFMSTLQRTIQSRESVEASYRVQHKDGRYGWVSSIFQVIGEEDGALLTHGIFMSLSSQFELQNNILDGADTGVYVIDPQTYELCLANTAAFQIMERPVCDYVGRKCFEVFTGRTEPCGHCMLLSGNEEPREMVLPWLGKTVAMTVKSACWMDKDVVIEYLNDITAQKKAQEDLKLGEERLATAIQHAGIQFWEYDARRDKAYMSEFSQESYQVPQIMENFPESFLELGIVHPEDEKKFRRLHEKLKNGAEDAMLEYRVRKPGEDYCWLLAHYTNSFDEAGRPIRAFATAEYIDRYKEQEEQFTIAAALTGVRVWTLDIQSRTIHFSDSDARALEVEKTLTCGSEDALRESGVLHPDDVGEVWTRSREMLHGADSVSFKARIRAADKYRWNRISYTVTRSKGGAIVKAIGSSIDIHEHVLLEQRFEQEIEHLSRHQEPNLVSRAQCNITRGTVDLYFYSENASVTSQGASYEDAVESLAQSAVRKEKQDELRSLLSRARVLDACARGESDCAIDYQRRGKDGTIFWANTTVRTYQNPATDDIMSFIYSYNIDDQKTAEAIVDRVVDTNFEYLTLFSTVTGLVEKTIDKTGVFLKPESGNYYEPVVEEGLCELLLPEEREEYLPLFRIGTITDKLSQNGTYSISADIVEPKKKEMRHKLWVFNWFDEDHTKVLCSRSDITEVYLQEQHQKEMLSAALTAAKQANAAKSDSLPHEPRDSHADERDHRHDGHRGQIHRKR